MIEWYSAEELNLFNEPYKKETMDRANKAVFDANAQCCDIMNHIIKEKAMEEIKIDIPEQYPKTYEECCRILDNHPNTDYVEGYKWKLMMSFQKLLICRDAYWKIAGEQMGLGKPWEPDWVNAIYTCTIICRSNKIVKDAGFDADNRILAFPIAEMRDAFYENFKDLIEQCKELL